MVRVGDSATLYEQTVNAAAATYMHVMERAPAAFADCHPLVLRLALLRADGKWRRMEVCDDNSIIIHNNPIW